MFVNDVTESPLGTQMSVAPSYQLNFGSLPFGAPGKLRGRTFVLQFHNAIAAQPDHIFLSSFNEFIAQPQQNPYKSINTAFSVGVPWDPERFNLWVDTWGSEYSRDIEPSVQRGDDDYQLMKSCLRVLRSGAYDCSNNSELCCSIISSQMYTNVFAYVSSLNNDHRLSTTLLASPWQQQCTPFTGPTTFCVNTDLTQGQGGPFILWSQPFDSDAIALYSCKTADLHFFSPRGDCEGQQMDELLGFMSPVRTSEMPRGLIRCYDHTNGIHFHSLDLPCPNGEEESLLGYVR